MAELWKSQLPFLAEPTALASAAHAISSKLGRSMLRRDQLFRDKLDVLVSKWDMGDEEAADRLRRMLATRSDIRHLARAAEKAGTGRRSTPRYEGLQDSMVGGIHYITVDRKSVEVEGRTPAKGMPSAAARRDGPKGHPPTPPDEGKKRSRRPKVAYALVQCKGSVTAGTELPITLGLSPEPVPDVHGGPLDLPHRLGYDLEIDVLAEGFDRVEGEPFSLSMPVTADDPWPRKVLHLIPRPELAGTTARIQVIFTVAGRTAGIADRFVAVTDPGAPRRRPRQPPPSLVRTPAHPGLPAPDLTVHITQLEQTPHRYNVLLKSPHGGLPDPPQFTISLPDAKGWAEGLYESFDQVRETKEAYTTLLGEGRGITSVLEPPFWDALATVKKAAGGRRPTLLLVTEEPYVPWELAVIPTRSGAAGTRFLCTQCVIGRWVPHAEGVYPPDGPVLAGRVVVVWSDYAGSNRPLKEAAGEQKDLARRFGAEAVTATAPAIRRVLGSPAKARVVHFAVHGAFDESGYEDGLQLPKGEYLRPGTVRGMDVKGKPMIFLNACQVGREGNALGRPSGLAPVLLERGAAAVIAPLWQVDDKVARRVAVDFYTRAFDSAPTPAAELLRATRSSVRPNASPPTVTKLAYQFFGHPNLLLRWAGPPLEERT